MLKNHLQKYCLVYVGAFVFVCLMLFFENHFSNSFASCKSQYSNSQAAVISKNSPVAVIVVVTQVACTVHFVNFNAGFFAFAAAFFAAIFAYNLAASTEKLWIAGNEDREATERAFVFLDGFDYELTVFSDGKEGEIESLPEKYKIRPELYITRFAVCPRWKNSGNTPTKRMSIKVDWQQTSEPTMADYSFRNATIPFFVAPKATEQSAFFEIPSVGALVEFGFRPDDAEPFFFIWGRGDYEDVFGKSHFVEWCYRIRLDHHKDERMRASFIQSGEYNRTDHN